MLWRVIKREMQPRGARRLTELVSASGSQRTYHTMHVTWGKKGVMRESSIYIYIHNVSVRPCFSNQINSNSKLRPTTYTLSKMFSTLVSSLVLLSCGAGFVSAAAPPPFATANLVSGPLGPLSGSVLFTSAGQGVTV